MTTQAKTAQAKTAQAKTAHSSAEVTGRCLCGGIRFRLTKPLRPVIICHCRQCAQWSGHQVAATSVSSDRFKFDAGADQLAWYSSSEQAERGFCRNCGSSLFWRPRDLSRVSIAAGSLDQPTGLEVSAHIYCDDISDYVASAADAPRFGGAEVSLLPPSADADKG